MVHSIEKKQGVENGGKEGGKEREETDHSILNKIVIAACCYHQTLETQVS